MAINRGLTVQFCFQYTDQNRAKLQKYDNADDLLKYLKTQNILEKFARFAESKGLKRRNILMYKAKEHFDRNLYGNIIYNMLNMEEYLKYLNQSDKTVLKALEILEKEEAFPKAPEQKLEPNEGTEKTIAQANQRSQEKSATRQADGDICCIA
jgi:carboxyl-terminal processing protease